MSLLFCQPRGKGVYGTRSRDELIIAEVTFSHSYLMRQGRLDIWESMGFYNLEIGQTPEVVPLPPKKRRWEPLTAPEQLQVMHAESIQSNKDEYIANLAEKGLGLELAERAGNRFACPENDWEDRLTAERLSLVLLHRLSSLKGLKEGGLKEVIFVVNELYRSAGELVAELPKL